MLFRLLFGHDWAQSYTVHEATNPPQDRMERAEALRFIKDGFTVPAFIAAPIWLAIRQLWLGLIGYLLVAAVIIGLGWLTGAPFFAVAIAFLGLHLFFGFEADDIERGDLEQRGFTTLGSVTGKGSLDSERRFFDIWMPGQPMPPPTAPAARPMASGPPRSGRGAVIGALSGIVRRT